MNELPIVDATPRNMGNGQVLRSFVDSIGTVSVTYTYPNTQEILMLRNTGNKDITVTVGGVSQVISRGQKWEKTVDFTWFSIVSSSGVQSFEAVADEKGSVFETAEGKYFQGNGGGSGGSGIQSYATLSALQAALPNGSTTPAWVIAENSWYYWSGEITADTTAPTVTASPAAGTYTGTQSVVLSANESATIYYTTNGSTPNESSSQYSSPISVPATVAIKYFGKDAAGNASAVQTASYTITVPDSTPPEAVTNLAAGTPTASTVPLTWTASIASDISKYAVLHSTDGTNFTTANGNVTGVSYTVTGLTAETLYTFRVVAIDTSNNQSTSNPTVQATTSTGLATIAFDDFNRIDNATTLDVTPTGSKTWEYKGIWGITANRAVLKTSTPESAAVIDAGKTDYTASVKVGAVGSGQRLVVRMKSYTEFYAFQYTGSLFTCYRYNPTFTAVGNSSAVTIVTGDVLKAECTGTTINFYVNNVLVQTVTDSVFNVTGVKTGIGGNGTAYNFDEFTLQG